MTSLQKLEIIKDQKNSLKNLLTEELGSDVNNKPFTEFSTLFGSIIDEKHKLSDIIIDRLHELDERYGVGFFKPVETTLEHYIYL